MYVHKYSLFNLSSGSRSPELYELHKHVVPKYAAKWEDLGAQLRIPEHHLKAIKTNKANHPSHVEQCCKAMLIKWMEITPQATWNELHMAINSLPDSCYDGR